MTGHLERRRVSLKDQLILYSTFRSSEQLLSFRQIHFDGSTRPLLTRRPRPLSIMDEIDEFCSVTGATRERAEFFLQASNGNLQAALDAFYSEEPVQNEVLVTSY